MKTYLKTIWFDWAGGVWINGEYSGSCTETEIGVIGNLLGWYDD